MIKIQNSNNNREKRQTKSWTKKEIQFILIARECQFPTKQLALFFKVSINAIEKLKQRVQDKLIDEDILYHLSSVSKKIENFYKKYGKDEIIKWHNTISKKRLKQINIKPYNQDKISNKTIFDEGKEKKKINKKKSDINFSGGKVDD